MAVMMAVSSVAPVIPAKAASGNMQITPIDFGDAGVWGDSTMLSSGGKNLLMDTYIRDKYDTLINYLDDHHFYNFDIYLSHYHYDHMDQISTIIDDSRFHVGTVYLPDPAYVKRGAQSTSYCKDFLNGYNNIVNTAKENGCKIVYLKKGSTFKVGEATVKVLWGCTYNSNSYDASYINNNSLVTKVTAGTVSYLTCGDIESEVENQLVASGIDISADIFKFNHHGGNSSNTAAFVKKVNPSFAYYNWLGDSPSSFGGGWVQTPINNLKNTCNIYSTRYNGMLTFTVKAGHISVAGERNMRTVTANIKDSSGNIVNAVSYQFNDALDYHITAKMKATAATVSASNSTTALPKRYSYTARFVETSGGVKYRNKDGSYSKNKFQTIDGNIYYFNANGYRLTSWKRINGKLYYFDSEGRMYLRWKRINGKKFYFDPVDGHVHTGWEWVAEKNAWYYLSPQYGYLLEGWKRIDGKLYYLTPGEFYAKTGWQTFSGKRFYFDPQKAFMYTGWHTIGGKKYYFANDGAMVTGRQTINGQVCTFDSNGVLISGSAIESASSTTTTTSERSIWNSSPYVTSAVTNTWAKSKDSDMPFDVTTKRNAAFVNNMLAYATYFVGKMDYASSVTNNDPNGLRFRRLISGGKTDCSWFVYHVLYKYGLVGEDFVHSYQWGNSPSTYPGGVNIGTDVSKASPGDIICTGKGTASSNSHVMIYLGGGKVVECAAGYGVIISDAPSSCRQIVHFSCLPNNPGADYAKSTTGTWVKSGNNYKFKVGSSYLTNQFQNIDGDIYYFNANGVRLTGWKRISGKLYYFTSDGKMYLRWKRINGKKYYFDPINGYMHTGWEWVAENNAWYYLNPSSGALVTGWQTINGKKYYFDSNNKMVTGTRTIDGKSYTFGSNGVLK